jgi:hypothetical protein
MPIQGKYIVDMLEDKLDEDMAGKWRWRPGVWLPDNAANPHLTVLQDLNHMSGWSSQAKTML